MNKIEEFRQNIDYCFSTSENYCLVGGITVVASEIISSKRSFGNSLKDFSILFEIAEYIMKQIGEISFGIAIGNRLIFIIEDKKKRVPHSFLHSGKVRKIISRFSSMISSRFAIANNQDRDFWVSTKVGNFPTLNHVLDYISYLQTINYHDILISFAQKVVGKEEYKSKLQGKKDWEIKVHLFDYFNIDFDGIHDRFKYGVFYLRNRGLIVREIYNIGNVHDIVKFFDCSGRRWKNIPNKNVEIWKAAPYLTTNEIKLDKINFWKLIKKINWSGDSFGIGDANEKFKTIFENSLWTADDRRDIKKIVDSYAKRIVVSVEDYYWLKDMSWRFVMVSYGRHRVTTYELLSIARNIVGLGKQKYYEIMENPGKIEEYREFYCWKRNFDEVFKF